MRIPFLRRLLGLALGRRLPIARGELEVPGIRGPVVIRRDRWGIPHVEAENDADAYFGLGFCHGQDRGFQIEMLMRAARGTVSALVGPKALPFDRLSRRIGFHRAALRQLHATDPERRGHVEAYVAGVNRGTHEGSPRRPHELVLLRARPSELTTADVRAILNLMSFALAANWDSELTRLRVLDADGPDALLALDPRYPDWLPVASPPGAAAGAVVDRLAEDLAAFGGLLGCGGGSNNWAVAPQRTRTGRPLLANDPHLPPNIPSQWYLAHVRTPRWAVAGASFVGTPSFPVGHNERCAWGLTAGLLDNTDLFVEEVGPDGRSVRCGDGEDGSGDGQDERGGRDQHAGHRFLACDVVEETIEVRGGDPVVERVLVTPRGPVIGPALEGESRAISIRATWLDPLPVHGYLSSHLSSSFAEFRGHFAEWPVLSANMVYADVDGTIGWQLAGRAPRRKKGRGTIPQPGWDPSAGWEPEAVPFEEMPHESDPPCGFVASANQKPCRDDAGPFLGADWIDGYRMARICEALQSRRDWDVEGCLRLQLDEASLPWREMRETILGAPAEGPSAPGARRALEVLRAWDGNVSADSPGATIFEHFLVEMVRRLVERKAPRSASWMLGKGPSPVIHRGVHSVRRVGHLSRLLRERPPGWLTRPWLVEVADALGAVVGRLEARHGRNPRSWAWGTVRKLVYEHPFGRNRWLARIFNLGPIPAGGDANTVAQAAVDPFEPTASPLFVPSLRAVMDVGKWENSRFALPGGQSGNPASPHYDDQLLRFTSGQGIAIAWTREQVEREATDVLRLKPR